MNYYKYNDEINAFTPVETKWSHPSDWEMQTKQLLEQSRVKKTLLKSDLHNQDITPSKP